MLIETAPARMERATNVLTLVLRCVYAQFFSVKFLCSIRKRRSNGFWIGEVCENIKFSAKRFWPKEFYGGLKKVFAG